MKINVIGILLMLYKR